MTLNTRKPTGAVPWPLILIEGPEKSGKAQPLHARIATPAGWTTMGQVEVGDQVLGRNGRPTSVTAVHERGKRPIYRLTFSDGAQVEACDEHLWATWTSDRLHSRYNKGPKKGQRNPRPAVIRTTAEIRELVLSGTVLHVPMAQPAEYAHGDPLPLTPYGLGLLLGDGSFRCRHGGPSFMSGDPELLDALEVSLMGTGDTLTRHPRPGTASVRGCRTLAVIRSLGLQGTSSATKFIPGQYMTAPAADRLALLQGLMDTDGGMEGLSITYTTVSQMLATQIRELVHSLGGTCSEVTEESGYTNGAGERIPGQRAHRLTMRLPLGVCPFRLGRKALRWRETRPTFSTPPRRTIRSVDFVGHLPARCITVAADDHLYLTDHFIVTHNSWACAELSASARVGRSLWLDLDEGAADEYGAVPGARYEVIEHDGSWASILGQVAAAKENAAEASAKGGKPVVLVIDSVTAEWDLLKDWASARAATSAANRKRLQSDPNAEVQVSMNLWNDATSRHRRLMTILMTFPGIVVITARGKDVASLDASGRPVEGTKEYKVEGHKTLGYDASVWVRLSRERPPVIVGSRSVHAGIRPGVDRPKEAPGFTLEWLIFDVLKCDPSKARVRDLVAPRPERTPEQIRDEALLPGTTPERIAELYEEARNSGCESVGWTGEHGDTETLAQMLYRTGTERKDAAATGGGGRHLHPAREDAPPPAADASPDVVGELFAADQEWAFSAIAQATAFATPSEGAKLWQDVVTRHGEGRVSDKDRQAISELMKGRLEDLRKPAISGTVVPGLDPEDPWAAKVEEITCAEDADAAAADVRAGMKSGNITQDRGTAILAAIDVRAAARENRAAA